MATKLLYMDDFDVVEGKASVMAVNKNEGIIDIVLDQTCFYPRGGGQDWDTGTISTAQGSFEVQEVRLDEEGVVHHFGIMSGEIATGDEVETRVDSARRQINTRLHSAGHLIDMAMSKLQPNWTPGRGAHFPHMSFVEYEVPEETADTEAVKAALEEELKTLTASDYQNQLQYVDKSDLSKYCRHVPENIPVNKPTRMVLYADDFGIPCGGTHVKNVKEIGEITITKIKVKKGLAKVSYAVAGIN